MKIKIPTLEELRNSCSHVLATAVLRLFPDTQLDIGHITEDGFYYDFNSKHKLTEEDLKKITEEMHKVIEENQCFECSKVSREEAKSLIKKIGQKTYKLSRLIPKTEPISFYKNGEFIDLGAGTHVCSTKHIKAFKLLSIESGNKQLQRIYGTAYHTEEELEQKFYNHRKIGKKIGLFEISQSVGPGLILWKPDGVILRNILQEFLTSELSSNGYQQVITPHIGRLSLFRRSGHYPYYKESQFFPIIDRNDFDNLIVDGCTCADMANKLEVGKVDGYLLKPMNCPMHIEIYKSTLHSYRDLPIRLAEFGTVYRWEKSGELNGMTRVRSFTQDDAHLFCTKEQVNKEIHTCLKMVKTVFTILGMSNYRVRIGLRDTKINKYIGSLENWKLAENALRNTAKNLGIYFTEEYGEAAFYGPKIDFIVKDIYKREWQLGTVQIDYNLPYRFDLAYIGSDNKKHLPVMIHRAPLGSLERFVGVLIEHFRGKFPTWLAPKQVRLLPINHKLLTYAQSVQKHLQEANLRVDIDYNTDKLETKIRRAELEYIPYILIIGKREMQYEKVSVRSSVKNYLDCLMDVNELLHKIEEDIAKKTIN